MHEGDEGHSFHHARKSAEIWKSGARTEIERAPRIALDIARSETMSEPTMLSPAHFRERARTFAERHLGATPQGGAPDAACVPVVTASVFSSNSAGNSASDDTQLGGNSTSDDSTGGGDTSSAVCWKAGHFFCSPRGEDQSVRTPRGEDQSSSGNFNIIPMGAIARLLERRGSVRERTSSPSFALSLHATDGFPPVRTRCFDVDCMQRRACCVRAFTCSGNREQRSSSTGKKTSSGTALISACTT